MKWLNKLERTKVGKIYIPNLMMIITMGSAIAYFMAYFIDNSLFTYLALIPSKVLDGEVWRLITFIFVNPTQLFWVIFTLYFYYIAGSALEREWGEFKFNVYYLFGIVATILISLFTNTLAVASVMNLSLFLAYAKLFPEERILFMFFIPVKIKWLGYLNWGLILYDLIMAIINGSLGLVLLAIEPVIYYLIFFAGYNIKTIKSKNDSVIRMRDYKKKMAAGKKAYIHKCEVCGITNEDDENMEFRYCSKCSGKHCYCEKHILNHEHIIDKK